MNNDGRTISTDDTDYDPSSDELMNLQNWQTLEQAE